MLNQVKALLSRAEGLEWLDHLLHDSHPFFESRVATFQDHENSEALLAFLHETEWTQTLGRVKAAVRYSARDGWEVAIERAWAEFPLASGDAESG